MKIVFGLILTLFFLPAQAETKQTRLPRQAVQTAVQQVMQGSELRLDNYGSKKKPEWYRQQSRLYLPTGEKVPFEIDRWLVGLSTPVGIRYWHYYLNELDLEMVQVRPAGRGFRLEMQFDERGNEIKGKCTRKTPAGKDNCEFRGERDIRMQDTRIQWFWRLEPVAGGVGYAPLGQGDISLETRLHMPKGLCKWLSATSLLLRDPLMVAMAGGMSRFSCEVVQVLIGRKLQDNLLQEVRQTFNRKPVRKAFARAVAERLGLLKAGWQVRKIEMQGSEVVFTLQRGDGRPAGGSGSPPPRKPAGSTPKPRSPVRIAAFEATPKVQYGQCPTVVRFSGRIRRLTPGEVRYHFLNHKGVRSGTYRLRFERGGEKAVIPWQVAVQGRGGMQLAAPTGKKSGYEAEGWVELVVEGPQGKRRRASYRVDCDPVKKMQIQLGPR